mmetsp:Transcript_42067/g.64478  ORF Transcript_42067/g.64478 Transcript_42067/m.64478 type:complete len:161 (-) Transcript_42067:26-508(-)
MLTLVVILTISANLARYFEYDDKKEFAYTFHIVPLAMTVLLGYGIGVPFGLRLVVNFFGTQKSSMPVMHGIGIYCYSFSSFLISTLLCGFFYSGAIQTLLILYSAVTSVMFLISIYWADLSTTLESSKRTFVVGAICIVQLILLIQFRANFFEHVTQDAN